MPTPYLTTAKISEVFAEEIKAHAGTVLDTFDDGTRLFTRSILPWVQEVRTEDRLQGGVALKASGTEIWLHPYVFRITCKNGAIMAHALHTRHLTNMEATTPENADATLHAALQDCCVEDAFRCAAKEFRSAINDRVDHELTLLSYLGRLASDFPQGLPEKILDRFFGEPERSRYALTNAVTSVARDTHDPELRWRLERLGGAIASGKLDDGLYSNSPLQTALLEPVTLKD